MVITIIVLLILVAVTIATLTGENGILTKAQEVAKIHEEEQKKEMDMLEEYETYIDTITNKECQIPQIFGNLDVTYKVEGTKVYFYPTINGESTPALYMMTLSSKMTEEQKKKILIDMAIQEKENISEDEALDYWNQETGQNFDSLIEAYDWMCEAEMWYYPIGTFAMMELLPKNEFDSIMLLLPDLFDVGNLNIQRHQHGIPITNLDKETILENLNKLFGMIGTPFESYEEIKNNEEVKMFAALGLQSGLFNYYWIDNGENFSQFYNRTAERTN